jgi:hypothetical protein
MHCNEEQLNIYFNYIALAELFALTTQPLQQVQYFTLT